jgi:hypothetical protein
VGTPEDRQNDNDKWITGTGNGKTKHLLNPKPKPKVHNAFAILSQPNAPTYYDGPSPTQQMNDNKTIIPPGPREHRRQKKMLGAIRSNKHYGGYAKKTVCSLTTASPKPRTNAPPLPRMTPTMQSMAINSTHAQCNQPTIRLTQHGQNTAYSLSSAFKRIIKKLNRNKHVSLAMQNKVHLFNATSTPSIMLTYYSEANRYYISKHDQCKAGLLILRSSTQ